MLIEGWVWSGLIFLWVIAWVTVLFSGPRPATLDSVEIERESYRQKMEKKDVS